VGTSTLWLFLAVCLGSSPAGADTRTDAAHGCLAFPSAYPPVAGRAGMAAAPQNEAQDDMVLQPGQPEFTVVNLPTTLRLPARRFAFRVSHRFGRDLTEGDFGDLLADLFGLDSGSLVGLELRYGLMPGWQAGLFRTSDRTIQLFTQVNVVQQHRSGVNVDAIATFEGTNNLTGSDPSSPTGEGQRSPALGGVISRVFGRSAAVNATLLWINNTNPLPPDAADDDDTILLGIGGRVRITPTVYLVGEIVPRLAGFRPGTTQGSFGIEKRVGGHAFQFNFSNGIASTFGQVARGAGSSESWFIGFNINRKFF
jgi:hypothetical protein